MKLNIKNTNQITPEDQNFVWFPFIPKNDVTMIVGSGGVGKTFFGIDILGKISNRVRMPNLLHSTYPTKIKTALVSSETKDSVFQSRLKTLFGGPSISSYNGDQSHEDFFPEEVNNFDQGLVYHIDPPAELLEKGFYDDQTRNQFLSEVSKAGIKVLMFDPLKSYMGCSIQSNTKIRTVFEKLAQELITYDITIIGLHHYTKAKEIQGSSEFTDGVRCRIDMVKGLDNPNITYFKIEKANNIPEDTATRVLAFNKNSIGNANMAGISYDDSLIHDGLDFEVLKKGKVQFQKEEDKVIPTIKLIIQSNPKGIAWGDHRKPTQYNKLGEPVVKTVMSELEKLGLSSLKRHSAKAKNLLLNEGFMTEHKKTKKRKNKIDGKMTTYTQAVYVPSQMSLGDTVDELLKDI